MPTELSEPVVLGAWLGRSQAFGMLASQTAAAQAQSLRRIREAGAYKLLHLTWDRFCREHAGLSRPSVDSLIRRFEEFGETYFRLCEIVRLSPATYRQLQPHIRDAKFEIDGELLEIAPANAEAIRDAILRLRLEWKRTQERADRVVMPALADLHCRLDGCFRQIAALAASELSDTEASALRGLVNFATHSLQRVARRVEP